MDASDAPDHARDIPPPDESGVRVVASKRFEARKNWYAVARSDSLPALLRWARVHSGVGTEIVRLEDDELMGTIESASALGYVEFRSLLRWVGMRMRPKRGWLGRFRRAA